MLTMKRFSLVLMVVLLAACDNSDEERNTSTTESAQTVTAAVDVAAVENIIKTRCATCHSAKPTDDVFKVAPGNVMLDSLEQMQRSAARIRARAVDSETMPFVNKTQITAAERAIIGEWVKAGAPGE